MAFYLRQLEKRRHCAYGLRHGRAGGGQEGKRRFFDASLQQQSGDRNLVLEAFR